MKLFLKREEEIMLIKQSGDILTKAIGIVGRNIKPGVNLLTLDKIAEEFIRDNHAIPACKGYYGFPATLCLSVNDVVLHGIPCDYELNDGDIISVDSVVNYNGYFSDCTYTYGVGEITPENKKLLNVTKNSLLEALKVANVGSTLGDIGYAIENYVVDNGFFVIEEYSGHGIGFNMHEDPLVPNKGKKKQGLTICNGLVIAIEPIVGTTTGETKVLNGCHNIVMKNGCMSAHFETTVGFFNGKKYILTDWKNCEL